MTDRAARKKRNLGMKLMQAIEKIYSIRRAMVSCLRHDVLRSQIHLAGASDPEGGRLDPQLAVARRDATTRRQPAQGA